MANAVDVLAAMRERSNDEPRARELGGLRGLRKIRRPRLLRSSTSTHVPIGRGRRPPGPDPAPEPRLLIRRRAPADAVLLTLAGIHVVVVALVLEPADRVGRDVPPLESEVGSPDCGGEQ